MTTAATPQTPDLNEIYRQLEKGTGHQWVNDLNVHELIAMAVDQHNALLEVTLREWQAPCAPAPEDS